MVIRQPIVAGAFYPFNKREISKFYNSVEGQKLNNGIGCIIPHAGWIYSGKTAVKALKRTEKADTFIIIGPNHNGFGEPISLYEPDSKWLLPNGEIDIDSELTQGILKNCNIIRSDNAAHNREHSIEVELPLMIENYGSDFKIVPLSMWDYKRENLLKVGKILLEVIMKSSKKIGIIASSDFSHYVPYEYAKKVDFKAIDNIMALDYDGFLTTVKENNISICGSGPIYVLLYLAKELKWIPELVEYTSSGEVTGDNSEVVAYCSILFKK